MADRRRSIEPSLFAHPSFRRATLVQRELWVGLIVSADDEGRVRADPLALAEGIFSPLQHQVTAQDVDDALAYWAAEGWLLRYGDGCAFLTGWYEHQYIEARTRESSSIPAPPCAVNSWETAEAVLTWFLDGNSKAKAYYRNALRAFATLSKREQREITSVPNAFRTRSKRVPNAPQYKESQGNTMQGKGGRAREAAPASDDSPLGTASGGNSPTADTTPADDPADADHMAACNEPELVAAATRYFADTLSPQRATAWAMDALRLTLLPGETVTRADVIAALGNGSGPVGKECQFPANWLDRLRGARASPAARSDAGWRIPDRSEYPSGEFKL